MVFLKDYQDLTDTLLHLKIQVRDSLPFAAKVVPDVDTPEQLFYWLKDKVIYSRDPSTTELLMTMQTQFDGSRTGTPGAGDCDDFTITSLASLIAAGFNDVKVVLVGRSLENPVHIYAAVKFNGKLYWFDLTNSKFNYQRTNYKYQQILDFSLN